IVRLGQGTADRPPDILDAGERVRGKDHPRTERELWEPEPLALVDQERRRPLVHLQYEPRSAHTYLPSQLADRTRPSTSPAVPPRAHGRWPTPTAGADTSLPRSRPAASRPRSGWRCRTQTSRWCSTTPSSSTRPPAPRCQRRTPLPARAP